MPCYRKLHPREQKTTPPLKDADMFILKVIFSGSQSVT